jgi:hypothetical protein
MRPATDAIAVLVSAGDVPPVPEAGSRSPGADLDHNLLARGTAFKNREKRCLTPATVEAAV